jgi:hypothetical protein
MDHAQRGYAKQCRIWRSSITEIDGIPNQAIGAAVDGQYVPRQRFGDGKFDVMALQTDGLRRVCV